MKEVNENDSSDVTRTFPAAFQVGSVISCDGSVATTVADMAGPDIRVSL